MNDKTLFCATLQDAFAQVSMSFHNKEAMPGQMLRFSTNGKPTDKAGWLRLFPDGRGAVFGCNREGTSFVWQQRDSNAPPPSNQEREAARKKATQARQQADQALAPQYANAAHKAAAIWQKAGALDASHAYVLRKGITPYDARQDKDGSVMLPVRNPDGGLQSLQFIGKDGSKRFLYQGKTILGRLFIGEPANGLTLILAEGWATGCSLHAATACSVVVGYSGGNLKTVAADLRRQFPDSPLQVAGDLEAHGKGMKYAQAAAIAGGGTVFLPVFTDGREQGDFNDLHQAEGLEVVRQQLNIAPDHSKKLASFLAPTIPKADARDGTTTTRPLTEYGNALRLLDANGDSLKYVHDAQRWLIWQNASWAWDDGAGVRSMAAELPAVIYREGADYLNDAEHFSKWARKSQELRTVQAAVALLSDQNGLRLALANIDADHFTIGVNQARQLLDLRTGKLRDNTPGDYITKSLSVNSVGNAAKAVRWQQFLQQVFEDDHELIRWLQRFCGYLLTGSTREQIFLFCFGHGANGKSVFIEVLKSVMGDYSRAIASETLSESRRQAGGATPDLAALIGARMVICSETEDNTALAESLVKSLVSGDSMAVRQLYSAPVQFTPSFKLVMAGNHKPIVRGNDNGIWRRVRLVPFNRTLEPEERNPHLLVTLKAEAPHILAWMVEGCLDWQRQGLADTPAAIRQATDAYQVDQDIMGAWLDECTSPLTHAETATGDLYANYKNWALDNGLHPSSNNVFGRRLSERGYERHKSGNKRSWRGLALSVTRYDDYARAKGGY